VELSSANCCSIPSEENGMVKHDLDFIIAKHAVCHTVQWILVHALHV